MSAGPVLEARGLVARRGAREVLHGVDLALGAGEAVGAGAQSHGGQPLSRTIFQRPPGSRRQVELNVPTRFPDGSMTGPWLSASVPDSTTSTVCGAQEKGASFPS